MINTEKARREKINSGRSYKFKFAWISILITVCWEKLTRTVACAC